MENILSMTINQKRRKGVLKVSKKKSPGDHCGKCGKWPHMFSCAQSQRWERYKACHGFSSLSSQHLLGWGRRMVTSSGQSELHKAKGVGGEKEKDSGEVEWIHAFSIQKPTTIRQRDLKRGGKKDTLRQNEEEKTAAKHKTKPTSTSKGNDRKNKKPGQQMDKLVPTQQASVPPAKPRNSKAKQPRSLQ